MSTGEHLKVTLDVQYITVLTLNYSEDPVILFSALTFHRKAGKIKNNVIWEFSFKQDEKFFPHTQFHFKQSTCSTDAALKEVTINFSGRITSQYFKRERDYSTDNILL